MSDKTTDHDTEPEGTAAHIELRSQTVQRCSACGSTEEHHVAFVRERGLCVS